MGQEIVAGLISKMKEFIIDTLMSVRVPVWICRNTSLEVERRNNSNCSDTIF